MGYNATVVVYLDALSDIAADASFGKKLVDAIQAVTTDRGASCTERSPSAGYHCNAGYVVEVHHADSTAIVAVGGNYGVQLAHCYGCSFSTPEEQLEKLRQVAALYGHRLVPLHKKADVKKTVTCALCGKLTHAGTAHRHQEGYIGECCWDSRLKSSE